MTTEQYGRGTKPFSLIPNEILDTAPDYHVIMVWCAIWRHGNGSDDGCWASVERLAKVARIGKHRTRDAIRWLKENRWLIAEERPGYTTRYRSSLEGGNGKKTDVLPLAGASAGPLPTPGTPSNPCKGYPFQHQEDEQDPLEQDPNSLLLSGISDEIPTSAAANEFCSVVDASFQLEPPSSQNDQKRKPRAKGDKDFEKFWRTYLANPHRTVSQSKPKALAQWQKTIRTQSPTILLEALETEIAHQQAAATAGTFVANLPDCFRWLRDERYATVHDRPVNPDMINHDTYVF